MKPSIVPIVILSFLILPDGLAQDDVVRVTAVRFDQAPDIDGDPPEAVWRTGGLMDLFTQVEPVEGAPPRNEPR